MHTDVQQQAVGMKTASEIPCLTKESSSPHLVAGAGFEPDGGEEQKRNTSHTNSDHIDNNSLTPQRDEDSLISHKPNTSDTDPEHNDDT